MKRFLAIPLLLFVTCFTHAVPVLVNYQGTYLDNAGVPVTQTNTPVIISIWDDATSTNVFVHRKYEETHTVTIDDGVFSLKIGAGTSPIGTFNALLFDTSSSLYLQLTINGEVMLPRVRFLSAPYTLQSENSAKLGNQPITYFASASALANLQTSLNTEVTDRSGDVNTEESARIAADANLQTQITNEGNTRLSADNTLQTNISSEASTRASADTTLQNNITSETTARTAADSAMEERMCRATYGAKWISSLSLCVGGSVNLTNVNLSGQDLRNVLLYGATITNTNFNNAQLNNTIIRKPSFTGTAPTFSSANLTDATLYDLSLSGVNLSNITATRLFAAAITACPSALPTGWYCVSGISSGSVPPYRLVGPGARFADDEVVSPLTWINTTFPYDLTGVNFKGNVFRNCTFSSSPRTSFLNATLVGATFVNCTFNDPIWNNTICPDGTNSDNNNNSCTGHGI